jgi:hypothetical protein
MSGLAVLLCLNRANQSVSRFACTTMFGIPTIRNIEKLTTAWSSSNSKGSALVFHE